MAWGIDKRLQIISNIMLSNIVIPRGIGRVGCFQEFQETL